MCRHHISIDLETRSGADISKTGSYRYMQDPDFRILLFGYKIDDEPEEVIDLTKGDGRLPDKIATILANPQYIKHAYNAAFEWYALNRAGYRTPIEHWQCTMVWSLYCGYAAGLSNTGEAIGLPEEDKKKAMAGKALIRYFCNPQKETKTFKKKYHDPEDDPEKWDLFVDYNRQDVVAEHAILQRLKLFPMPESEWDLWRMDIRMNALGVRVDEKLIQGALGIDARSTAELTDRAKELTGLANPNSTAQLLPWLREHGCGVSDLQKLTVEEELQKEDLDPEAREALELRRLLGKTSIKKYVAMETAKGEGDRIRGVSQFYGANRTGRYAGRLVQLQNLPRNYLTTLDAARRMTRSGNYEGLKMIYGNVPDTLSQLIRTAFIPSEGRHFVIADFSAIEARVIAWMAGEKWVSDVFANNGDIYCETASAMFGVPVGKHGPNAELRQKGKIATLALGYQGSAGSMIAMGALRMGIPEEDLPDIVEKWRASHPKTVALWYQIGEAAFDRVAGGADLVFPIAGGKARLTFRMESDLVYGQTFLTIELPTGRKLFYPKPYIKENQFGKPAIHYYGVKQTTGKWGPESTYGGKLTENCLSGDTLVITDNGIVPLMKVTRKDRLWDGESWVRHDGVIEKGIQSTISVDGVRMTPDHKIFTAEGWKRADESEGSDREDIQWKYGACLCRNRRAEVNLESPLRILRENVSSRRFRDTKGEAEIMRVHEEKADQPGCQKTWDVEHTDLECMAFHEGTVRDPNGTVMEELRRAGHPGLQEMVGEFRSVPGGHGLGVPERSDDRPDRCEWGLLPGELQMGNDEGTGQEQKEQPVYKHTGGPYDRRRSGGEIRSRRNDDPLQVGSRNTGKYAVNHSGREEPVYDIRNAGPNHCFYVMSEHGPMKVHNCVQAIARDCLCETIRRVYAKGWDLVFHVHDEVIVDVPNEIHTEDVCALMDAPISWAPGLILKGAGFEADYYMKD